eukprot:GHVN01005705.1.p1 GENE.GHVN01005705.1~~GHVN01005705.1.p1  ORF type:complete len:794 (+),score=146.81 GHVN01005705.1:139-2520(+)
MSKQDENVSTWKTLLSRVRARSSHPSETPRPRSSSLCNVGGCSSLNLTPKPSPEAPHSPLNLPCSSTTPLNITSVPLVPPLLPQVSPTGADFCPWSVVEGQLHASTDSSRGLTNIHDLRKVWGSSRPTASNARKGDDDGAARTTASTKQSASTRRATSLPRRQSRGSVGSVTQLCQLVTPSIHPQVNTGTHTASLSSPQQSGSTLLPDRDGGHNASLENGSGNHLQAVPVLQHPSEKQHLRDAGAEVDADSDARVEDENDGESHMGVKVDVFAQFRAMRDIRFTEPGPEKKQKSQANRRLSEGGGGDWGSEPPAMCVHPEDDPQKECDDVIRGVQTATTMDWGGEAEVSPRCVEGKVEGGDMVDVIKVLKQRKLTEASAALGTALYDTHKTTDENKDGGTGGWMKKVDEMVESSRAIGGDHHGGHRGGARGRGRRRNSKGGKPGGILERYERAINESHPTTLIQPHDVEMNVGSQSENFMGASLNFRDIAKLLLGVEDNMVTPTTDEGKRVDSHSLTQQEVTIFIPLHLSLPPLPHLSTQGSKYPYNKRIPNVYMTVPPRSSGLSHITPMPTKVYHFKPNDIVEGERSVFMAPTTASLPPAVGSGCFLKLRLSSDHSEGEGRMSDCSGTGESIMRASALAKVEAECRDLVQHMQDSAQSRRMGTSKYPQNCWWACRKESSTQSTPSVAHVGGDGIVCLPVQRLLTVLHERAQLEGLKSRICLNDSSMMSEGTFGPSDRSHTSLPSSPCVGVPLVFISRMATPQLTLNPTVDEGMGTAMFNPLSDCLFALCFGG